MTKYFINFEIQSDSHVRAVFEIMRKAGYKTEMRSCADGESWDYFTDKPVDDATRNELKKIGVIVQ